MKQHQLYSPKYRPDIDGLRALAVLSVVAFHAFPDWIPGGFIGVDIFFVISGFLISTIIFENLDKGTFRFSDFYARRIKRIFPALLLVLFSSFVFGWFVLLADEYEQLGKHIAAAAGFVSNFVFWGEAGYFDNAADTKPLLHLWSLGIEEQFYIFWPLIVWFTWKRRLNILKVIIVLMLLSFVLNLIVVQRDPVAAFYSPLTRFWELLFGSILAWYTLYKKYTLHTLKKKANNVLVHIFPGKMVVKDSTHHHIISNTLSVLGLLFFVGGFCFINKEAYFPGVWALLPVLGTILIISAGSKAGFNRTILSNRIVVWFGLISYPLYLWHWPMLSFARIILGQTPSISITLGLVLISIALAWLTYRFIERPIRQSGRTLTKVISLCVGCVLLLTLGLLSYQTNRIVPKISINTRGDSALKNFDQILSKNPEYLTQIKSDMVSAEEYKSICVFSNDADFGEDERARCNQHLKIVPEKLNVMLIGDSRARDLYVALKETHKNLNLLFSGVTSCDITGWGYSQNSTSCSEVISLGLDFATKNKPDYVVISSKWGHNFSIVTSIIQLLKKANVSVILVGPPPEFREDTPRFISRRKENDNLASLSMKNFNFEKLVLNDRMRIFAQEQGVQFLDIFSYFCSKDGICELMDNEGSVYIRDHHHLTRVGERFWGNKLLEDSYFQ